MGSWKGTFDSEIPGLTLRRCLGFRVCSLQDSLVCVFVPDKFCKSSKLWVLLRLNHPLTIQSFPRENRIPNAINPKTEIF